MCIVNVTDSENISSSSQHNDLQPRTPGKPRLPMKQFTLPHPFSSAGSKILVRSCRQRPSLRVCSYHNERPPAPLRLPSGYHSLLPLICSSSNLVLPNGPWQGKNQHFVGSRAPDGSIVGEEIVIPFFISRLTSPEHDPVGFLRPEVTAALERDHRKYIETGAKSPWDIHYCHTKLESVSFAPWVNAGGKYLRTMHMERLINEWKQEKVFTDILRGDDQTSFPRCVRLMEINVRMEQ